MEYVMWLFTYYLMNSSKESIWYSAWYIVDTYYYYLRFTDQGTEAQINYFA